MKNRLIYAASERDADLLYATRFFAPDPFLWFSINGKTYAFFNALEIDRAKREAHVDHVLSLTQFGKKIPKKTAQNPAGVTAYFLHSHRIKVVEVPFSFPAALAGQLKRHGITVKPCETSFFPTRTIKSTQEIQWLRDAQKLAELGMKKAKDLLQVSTPSKKGILKCRGKTLTSEWLQGEINATIAQHGGSALHTIVAGGDQACDPHEQGSGPLPAHKPVIVDIFPRVQKTGYWGDITRTFVRGRPSDAVQKLYHTVLRAHQDVLKRLRPNCDGLRIQNEVRHFFHQQGFPTEIQKQRNVGFFHGLGHGVGLEIHELPRFASGKLKRGNVITVEPGLYYPGIGGVRIEDLVVINSTGYHNLTRFSKEWIL